MDENEVIKRLSAHLESKGWLIRNRVAAGKPGIDVIAVHPEGRTFWIEAKGGTSSRAGSARHGKPCTQTQVLDVTSKGLMQFFHHIACKPSSSIIAL